jgi:hypothetical protein
VANVHIGGLCAVCRKGSVIQTGQGKSPTSFAHAHREAAPACGAWTGIAFSSNLTKRQLARRHRSVRLVIPRVRQMDWSPPHLVFMLMTAAIFLFAIFLATRR